MHLAQKMEMLLVACELARADGWKIAATGETIAPHVGCCCPFGALALVSGYAWREEPDDHDAANAGLRAIEILGEGTQFGFDFMRGFDGPEYAEAAGLHDDDLAYAYGRAFRGFYAPEN